MNNHDIEDRYRFILCGLKTEVEYKSKGTFQVTWEEFPDNLNYQK